MDQILSQHIATPITNWLGDRHKDFQKFVSQHHSLHEPQHIPQHNPQQMPQHKSKPKQHEPQHDQVPKPQHIPQSKNITQKPEFLRLIALLMSDNNSENRSNKALRDNKDKEIQNFINDFNKQRKLSDKEHT